MSNKHDHNDWYNEKIKFADDVSSSKNPTPFEKVVEEIMAMHNKKQADYGRPEQGDPFANVRASEDFGIPGWIGAIVRANDKVRRLQKAARGGKLANESIEDSLLDAAVYFMIALCLFREENGIQ